MIFYNNDPYLLDICSSRKKAQKEYDDIIWDHGVNDPRLAALATQIKEWQELEEKGETIQPMF